MLFQADSPAWSDRRYYQDAAIRAAFEKMFLDRHAGKPPRVLLALATGSGKTVIATNLLAVPCPLTRKQGFRFAEHPASRPTSRWR